MLHNLLAIVSHVEIEPFCGIDSKVISRRRSPFQFVEEVARYVKVEKLDVLGDSKNDYAAREISINMESGNCRAWIALTYPR